MSQEPNLHHGVARRRSVAPADATVGAVVPHWGRGRPEQSVGGHAASAALGHKLRVPAAEGVGQLVVEDGCPDLEQEVDTSRRAAHLLLFDHALAHDLVARRLHEGVGDRLARAVGAPRGSGSSWRWPRCSGRIRPASSPACAGLDRRRRHRGPSRGPRLPAGHGRRCRARENQVSRPSYWAARAPIPASMPLAICPITVRRIVMWNQSISCSARGLR